MTPHPILKPEAIYIPTALKYVCVYMGEESYNLKKGPKMTSKYALSSFFWPFLIELAAILLGLLCTEEGDIFIKFRYLTFTLSQHKFMGTHVTTVVHLSEWELMGIEGNKEILLKSILSLPSNILNPPYYYPPLAIQPPVATTTTNDH